jgi:hypothetical protein
MISSWAFAASRDVVSGIGTLSETRMPASLRSTRSTRADRAAPASTSDCRRSSTLLRLRRSLKVDSLRDREPPSQAQFLSRKIWPAEAATVRSISGAGKRQPRPAESAAPLITLRDT